MEKKELVPVDRHRYIVLAIYDIVDNKRRNKMVKYLEQYATRVQKSCFEGFLTLKQYKKMEREASQIIDEESDSLRIYILQDHAQGLSWGRGEVKNDNVIIY